MVDDPNDPPDSREAYEALQREVTDLREQLAAALASGESSRSELSALRTELDQARERLAAVPAPAAVVVEKTKRVDGFFEVDDDK